MNHVLLDQVFSIVFRCPPEKKARTAGNHRYVDFRNLNFGISFEIGVCRIRSTTKEAICGIPFEKTDFVRTAFEN